MRRAARVLSFGAAAIAIACASCFILTGGTDGYAPIPDARADSDEDAPGLTLGCLSATDCAVDGGSQICCLVLTASSSAASSSAVTRCQTGPCGALAAQMCAANAECGDVACLSQHCTFAGATFTVHACGTLPVCTP
jgi:hypothetical protein